MGEPGINVVQQPADDHTSCLKADLSEGEALLTGHAICERRWDDLLCWPRSPANTTLAIPCQASKAFMEIVTTSKRSSSAITDVPGMAYQRCEADGTWSEKANYEDCTSFLNDMLSEEETRRKVRHAVSLITFGLCLGSMVLLLVALGLFSFFKSLNCDRLKVHKNFMMALVIRYAVSVVYYEPYIYGDQAPSVWFKEFGKGYLCQLVLVFLMYGYVAPVFWMFIEGLYLHSRIVTNVFDSPAPFKLYYFIGWVVPLICVISWASTMAIMSPGSIPANITGNSTTVKGRVDCSDDLQEASKCRNNQACWEGYTEQPYAMILSIPMTICLMINLLFLVNVVRILMAKLRGPATGNVQVQSQPPNQSREGAHVFKAFRATLILFPLLGVTNLLFFINPKNGTHDKIYMLFNATMQSSQGIFLAVLYCFLNVEVQESVRRHLKRLNTRNEFTRNNRASTSHRELRSVSIKDDRAKTRRKQLSYSMYHCRSQPRAMGAPLQNKVTVASNNALKATRVSMVTSASTPALAAMANPTSPASSSSSSKRLKHHDGANLHRVAKTSRGRPQEVSGQVHKSYSDGRRRLLRQAFGGSEPALSL